MEEQKFCNTCKQTKLLTDFYISKANKDGHSSQCKKCINKRQKIYNEKNKERIAQRDAEYRERNKDKIVERRNSPERRAYEAQYRLEHREQIMQTSKEYYWQHREEELAKNRERYQKNKEQKRQYRLKNLNKIKEQQRLYRERNKEKLKAYDKLRNEKNKINRCFSHSLSYSLKGAKADRHWEDLVPYNLEQLKQHLEEQFDENMNWNNYGEWHIDHIIPQDTFEIKSEQDEQFKICWSLYNLRPLWKKDNWSRPKDEGSDIPDEIKIDIISKALNIDYNRAKEVWLDILNKYLQRVGAK